MLLYVSIFLFMVVFIGFYLKFRIRQIKRLINNSFKGQENSIKKITEEVLNQKEVILELEKHCPFNFNNVNENLKGNSYQLSIKSVEDLDRVNLDLLSLRQSFRNDEKRSLSILHSYIRNLLNDYSDLLWQCNFQENLVNSKLDNIKYMLNFSSQIGLENTAYKYNKAINFMYMMMYDDKEIMNLGNLFSQCDDCWDNTFYDTWKFYILSLENCGKQNEARVFLQQFIKTYGIEKVHNYLPFAQLSLKYGYYSKIIEKAAFIMDVIDIDNKENRIKDLFKNKTIAVVGNSRSILEKKYGKEIDEHDIVIRFNNYVTKGYEEYVGTKTNVWAFNGNSLNQFRDINEYEAILLFPCVMCELSDESIELFYSYLNSSITTIFYPIKFFKDLLTEIQHWVTTGNYLFYTLIKYGFNPSRYGFQDPNRPYELNYFMGNMNNPVSWHHMAKETEFIQSLLKKH